MTVHIKYVPKTQFVTVQVGNHNLPEIELPNVERTDARGTT